MQDKDIDTSDIPEIKDWSGAVTGKFYRPKKTGQPSGNAHQRRVTIRKIARETRG